MMSSSSYNVNWPMVGICIVLMLAIFILLIVLTVKFKSLGKVIGAILSISGIGAIIYGIVRINSLESKILRSFGDGDITLVICFVMGGIAMVLGIILIVIASSGNNSRSNNFIAPTNTLVNVVKIRCLKCQAINDETSRFCNECGYPLVTDNVEE